MEMMPFPIFLPPRRGRMKEREIFQATPQLLFAFFQQGDVMGVDSPEKRNDPDDPETGAGRFVLELPAADHLDPGPGPLDPAAERPLGPM